MSVYPYSQIQQFSDDLRVRLFPLICEINALPVLHFHTSWLDTTDEQADLQVLLQYSSALPDLSRFLLKRYRLKSVWIHDFVEPRTRILLINAQALNKLVFYLGLIIISPHLRKIIDGNMLRKLGEAVGIDAFEFARKKAAFYNPGFIGKIIKVDSESINPEGVYEEAMKKGVMCLGLIFWEEEKAIRNRVAIKLPKKYARLIVSGIFDKAPTGKLENYRKAIFNIFLKLTKEIEPSWKTIFV